MRTTNLAASAGNKGVTPHLASLLYQSSQTPKGVHRQRTSRTTRDNASRHGIKARRTSGLLQLLLLHVAGGHGAIKNKAVALIVGMVDVGMMGEVGSCC